MSNEILPELLGVDTLSAGATSLRRMSAEHLGELTIEVDELLGNLLTFLRIGVQEFRLGHPPQDGPRAADNARAAR